MHLFGRELGRRDQFLVARIDRFDVGAERLSVVGLEQADADAVTGNQLAHLVEHRVHDRLGLQGREDGLIDLIDRGQGAELSAQAVGHRIERCGEILEFITTRHGDSGREIPLRDALGAFLQLFERHQTPPDLDQAHEQHDPQSHEDDEQKRSSEIAQRGKHIGAGLAEHHRPAGSQEPGLQEDRPIARQIGALVVLPLKLARPRASRIGCLLSERRRCAWRTKQHETRLIQHTQLGQSGQPVEAPQVFGVDFSYQDSPRRVLRVECHAHQYSGRQIRLRLAGDDAAARAEVLLLGVRQF